MRRKQETSAASLSVAQICGLLSRRGALRVVASPRAGLHDAPEATPPVAPWFACPWSSCFCDLCSAKPPSSARTSSVATSCSCRDHAAPAWTTSRCAAAAAAQGVRTFGARQRTSERPCPSAFRHGDTLSPIQSVGHTPTHAMLTRRCCAAAVCTADLALVDARLGATFFSCDLCSASPPRQCTSRHGAFTA